MQKYTQFIMMFTLAIFITIGTTQTAQADSEFGAPFWNQPTAALDDSQQEPQNELLATDMDAAAAALQDIQPAAGDETTEADAIDNAELDAPIGP